MGILDSIFNFITYRKVKVNGATLMCLKEHGDMVVRGIIPDSISGDIRIPGIINNHNVSIDLNLEDFPFSCHALYVESPIKNFRTSAILEIDDIHFPYTIRFGEEYFHRLFNPERTSVIFDDKHPDYRNIHTVEGTCAVLAGDDKLVYQKIGNKDEWYIPEGTKDLSSKIIETRKDARKLVIPASYSFSVDGNKNGYEDIESFFKRFTDIEELIIDPDNPGYAYADGVLYEKNQGLGLYARADQNHSLNIPEGVEYISPVLLKEVTEKITFPSTFNYGKSDNCNRNIDEMAYDYIDRIPCHIYTITETEELLTGNGFFLDKNNRTLSGFRNNNVEHIRFPEGIIHFSKMKTRKKELTRTLAFPSSFDFSSFYGTYSDSYSDFVRFLSQYPNLEDVRIGNGNRELTSKDGLIIDRKQNLVHVIDRHCKELRIPEGVEALIDSTFDGLDDLEYLSFPSSFDFNSICCLTEYVTEDIRKFLEKMPKLKKLDIPQNPILQMNGCFLMNRKTKEIIRVFNTFTLDVPAGTEILDMEAIANPEIVTRITIPSSLKSLTSHHDYKGKTNEEKTILYAEKESELLQRFTNLLTFQVSDRNPHYRIKNHSLVRKYTYSNGDIFHTYLKIMKPEDAIIRIPDEKTFMATCIRDTHVKAIQFDTGTGIAQKLLIDDRKYNADEIRIPIDAFNGMYGQFAKTLMEMNVKPFDDFGMVPMKFWGELPYRQSGRALTKDNYLRDEYSCLKPNDRIYINIHKIISVMNTFPCISNQHHMIPITALIGIKRSYDLYPEQKAVPCYYCRECNRFFMYTTDYNAKIRSHIESDGTKVFNRFNYKGFLRGYDYTITDNLKETSILKDAGYEVNAVTGLSESQRLHILTFLWNAGVESHVIISYINGFIHFNGKSHSRDMTLASQKWKNDLENFEEYISKHNYRK